MNAFGLSLNVPSLVLAPLRAAIGRCQSATAGKPLQANGADLRLTTSWRALKATKIEAGGGLS